MSVTTSELVATGIYSPGPCLRDPVAGTLSTWTLSPELCRRDPSVGTLSPEPRRRNPDAGTLSPESCRRHLDVMCCTGRRCYRINCHCICHRCRSCDICAPGSMGAGIGLTLGAAAVGKTHRCLLWELNSSIRLLQY